MFNDGMADFGVAGNDGGVQTVVARGGHMRDVSTSREKNADDFSMPDIRSQY